MSEQYIVFDHQAGAGDFGKSFMYRIPVFELYMQEAASFDSVGRGSHGHFG